MKLAFMLGLFFAASISCNAQYTWLALPDAPVSYRFDDFYFINPDTGWAINPNYHFAAPFQYGRIFKTTDGGNTWQKLKDSSNTYYRSVGFADALTGWVGNLADTTVYRGLPATTDTVPMYQTSDGGVTWSPVNLPNPHPAGICGISVVTDSVVYAYGRFFGPAGYVKTTDKGATWLFTDMNTYALGLIDGRFFDKNDGFITGMGIDHKAIILHTNDGGATWQFVYHSTRIDSDRVWKIYFPSRNIGYASIEYGGSHYQFYNTYFLKTTDGGNTWVEKPFLATYNEEGIGFINDQVGWIGGDNILGTYVTKDGGNTWNGDETFGLSTPPYTTGTEGFSMNRFRSFGDTLLYASGNTIYKLKILPTGIREVQTKDQTLNNYPNPFENKTTITYDLPETTNNIRLEVRNVLGEKVFANNFGAQNKGHHEVLFNQDLPAGTYYYTIINDKVKLTKKMLIIR